MLKLNQISKHYGSGFALEGVDLEIPQGQFAAVLGPSGCGKTTLLKIIAGVARPDEGRVLWAGRDITDQNIEKRPFSLVFQNYALLPNLSVLGNIAFPLAARRYAGERSWLTKAAYFWGRLESRLPADDLKNIETILKLLHLENLQNRRVQTLSGGEAQRVALARSLVTRPQLLLMDEPLANLDRQLKLELRAELRRLHRDLGITFLYVTHDQEEAVSLAGQIFLLNQGRLVQSGSPRDILKNPANSWVKGFFNINNIVQPDLLGLVQ